MRLIDADALLDALYDAEFCVLCPLDEVSGVIDASPTVDSVPVVRCKDCTEWTKYTRECGELGACAVYDIMKLADGYCDYGARRRADNG